MRHFLHSKTFDEQGRSTGLVQSLLGPPCGIFFKFNLNIAKDFATDFRPGYGDFSLPGAGFRALYPLFM